MAVSDKAFFLTEQATTSSSHAHAETRDRTGDLQIFSLTLSQLSYRGSDALAQVESNLG